jgi:complement component 1 Q subcomponent-binding protein
MTLHQFESLDLSLQEEFEKFLQERGINESLAFFVPEYAQYKEQKVCANSGYYFPAFVR